MSISFIYSVPAPYDAGHVIQVFGETDMGSYDWRVVNSLLVPGAAGYVVRYVGLQGYGVPEIALRDALVAMS